MVTCSPILAQACPLLRPKLGLFCVKIHEKSNFFKCYGMIYRCMHILKLISKIEKICSKLPFLAFFTFFHWKMTENFEKSNFLKCYGMKFKRFKKFENSKKFEKCMFKEFNKFNSLHVRIVFFVCFFGFLFFLCFFLFFVLVFWG